MAPGPSPFEGAAEYYDRFRPGYPQAAFEYVIGRFVLDRSSRILDLGCGTGHASFPLARVVGEIVAMDPDPGMIEVAKRSAADTGIRNVTFINAGSSDLSSSLGRFCLVVMGQSFHWMNRDQVLRDLHPIVDVGGGLALIAPAHGLVLEGEGPPQQKTQWEKIADDVLKDFIGERARHPRSNAKEPRHEAALLRSQFRIAEYQEFEAERTVATDDVIGWLYSLSGDLRGQLGDRRDAFEAELRTRLRAVSSAGKFAYRSRTGVLIALK